MGGLILRRLVATLPVLFLVTLGVFLLIHLVPGDPVEAMLGESQDAVAKETLRRELGFDQPLYVQYVTWMGRVVQGDLGRSVRTHQTVLDNVSHRIRPTLELALSAVITRTLRSSLLETLSDDYVRTARAKGLGDWAVVRSHALKNALIPVVTVVGLQFGTLIGGAVITEYIFALPGVGRLVVDAVFARDYPLVQGVVLLITVGFIASNLVVDILYGWLDPRIRYA